MPRQNTDRLPGAMLQPPMTSDLPATMRAAVYRGRHDVQVETVPVPHPGPGQVLVKVAACGICATDLKKIAQGTVSAPRVFGHETAGEIVAIGPGVAQWNVADRVVVNHHVPCMVCHYCARRSYAQCETYRRTAATAGFEPAGGGFAEYVLVLDWAVEPGLVGIPQGVAWEAATFVEPVNTVLKGVRRLQPRAGDTVAVFGQGQIGLLFTQLLRREGAAVLGIDPLPVRRELATMFGADCALDPAGPDVPGGVREITDGRGADAAVVTAHSRAAVDVAVASVRAGGRVLLFAHTAVGDPVTVDAGAVCALEKDVIGSYSSDITLQADVADVVFGGCIRVSDLVTHRFPLERIDEALEAATSPDGRALKVMVMP